MRRRSAAMFQVLLLLLLPGWLTAQSRFFATALAGGGLSLNDLGPGTGGGFGYQGAVGVVFRGIAVGGEAGEHARGSDHSTTIYGGFVRFSAFGSGPVQPYFTLGLGSYRYSSVSGGATTALGGSIGPGARFRVGIPRVSLVLEARIHSDLDQEGPVSAQEFVTALGGFQIGF